MTPDLHNLNQEFTAARAAVLRTAPLIHSITNPISINDCANAVLALGAKPIMAEHPREVRQIASMAAALTVSLGNITDARAQSIMLAGREKAAVIDLVGITCSPLRMELAKRFIQECHPAVIKGNVSEIRAILGAGFHDCGIDVSGMDAVTKDNREGQLALAALMQTYAAQTHAAIAASGEVDIIASPSSRTAYFIENGTANMARVTGTGCMLTCITGVYLAVTAPEYAAALAAVTLGIAGETADASHGLGSYHTGLIDALSTLTDEALLQKSRVRQELI